MIGTIKSSETKTLMPRRCGGGSARARSRARASSVEVEAGEDHRAQHGALASEAVGTTPEIDRLANEERGEARDLADDESSDEHDRTCPR